MRNKLTIEEKAEFVEICRNSEKKVLGKILVYFGILFISYFVYILGYMAGLYNIFNMETSNFSHFVNEILNIAGTIFWLIIFGWLILIGFKYKKFTKIIKSRKNSEKN